MGALTAPLAGGRALARRWLPGAALGALLLLLLNMFFLRHRVLADVVTLAVTGVGVLALLAGVEGRRYLRGATAWLGLACLLAVAAALLSAAVDRADAQRAVHNLLLIGFFLLFARAALREWGEERVLLLLFAAGALSAAASVGLHLAEGRPLSMRIEMLGRSWNPIPAAAAVAAAGLAGLALLRGAPRPAWQRAAMLAGIGAVLLAMLLTQSRGPLIGAVLAAALLLAPPRLARHGWWLPLLVFPAASSLVLVEEWVRALLCTGDGVFCRPSLRLPLWQQSVALIAEHPWAGLGMGHRLGEGWLNNPQNAVLGTAVYLGLPFLAAALAAFWLLLRRLRHLPPAPATRWAGAMLVFSAAYFAFEPSPFAFYNAHYLFLWLPVAVVLGGATAPRAPVTSPFPARA